MSSLQDLEHSSSEHGTKAELVCEVFSELAPKYERFNTIASFGIYKSWEHALVKEASSGAPVSRVLDIAAGTGKISCLLAQRLKLDHIQVTDFCKEMLDVAQMHYMKLKVEDKISCSMEFEVQDAHKLSHPDESFDMITVAYGIRNFEDRMQAMREAHRVLKTGGKYLILEFSHPKCPPWRALYHSYLRLVIPSLGRLMIGKQEGFDYFKESILNFPNREVLIDELKQIGFRDVRCKSLSGGIVCLFSAIK